LIRRTIAAFSSPGSMDKKLSRNKVRLFVSACEPSGDQLGAELMAALRAGPSDDVECIGVGGTAMSALGLNSLIATGNLAVMGLGDVLPRARHALSLARRAADAALEANPDLVVTIDSMGFHKAFAGHLRQQNPTLPIVHYAAPKYWAWWPGRAKRIRGLFDEILCLFPFEPEFFSRYDLTASYVGHPVVNRMNAEPGQITRLRIRLGLSENRPVALVLPGSRPAEIRRLLPIFGDTIRLVRQTLPYLVTLTPTIPLVSEAVTEAIEEWGPHSHVIEDATDKAAAFHLGDAALAASGTVSLELAACNIPQIAAYKIGPVSALIARRMIRTDHVSPVNILAGQPVVPEFLQAACRPDALAARLSQLLSDPLIRAGQRAVFSQVISDLGGDGTPPAARAAQAIRKHFPSSAD